MPGIFPIPDPQSPVPRWGRFVTATADALAAAVLAPACAVCEAVLDAPLSGCVCRICWAAVRPITPPVCDTCGNPLARPSQSPVPSPHPLDGCQSLIPNPQSLCAMCGRHRSSVIRARAVGEYDGALRDIIHALKYGGRRSLARPLAALMRERGAELLAEADCVVPVPLHWRREYSRGFNQARELASHLGPPVIDALVRRRHTRAQVELTANRRRANVLGAFRLRRGWLRHPDMHGVKVLLIDDVSTTGATLESCATVMRTAGASEVCALTAARAITRRSISPNP
jgi:ComF family protein